MKVESDVESGADSDVSLDEFINTTDKSTKKSKRGGAIMATVFRLKEWKPTVVSEFIQQFKGTDVSEVNIRSLLTNEVELELKSRGVINLNNPLSILKACKRFVAMDEKDREEGIIDRLEALKWPTPTRDQSGKENIRAFLHAIDSCLNYKDPSDYIIGAKKIVKMILMKVPDYLALSPVLANKPEYQSRKGVRDLLLSQARIEHNHWQISWAKDDKPRKISAKQVEVEEAIVKDDPQLQKFTLSEV